MKAEKALMFFVPLTLLACFSLKKNSTKSTGQDLYSFYSGDRMTHEQKFKRAVWVLEEYGEVIKVGKTMQYFLEYFDYASNSVTVDACLVDKSDNCSRKGVVKEIQFCIYFTEGRSHEDFCCYVVNDKEVLDCCRHVYMPNKSRYCETSFKHYLEIHINKKEKSTL